MDKIKYYLFQFKIMIDCTLGCAGHTIELLKSFQNLYM
jgi:16S rRNA C1402 N4-methylase RsmH